MKTRPFLNKLIRLLIPEKIRWKAILVESGIFLSLYILWLVFRSPETSNRFFVGSLSVLVPYGTVILLIIRLRNEFPAKARRAWLFLAIAFLCLLLGGLIRTYYESVRGIINPILSTADMLNFLSYPFFFVAVLLYPFESRYLPSRFRFILDIVISSGVAASLGLLVLARPAFLSTPGDWVKLVPLAYPIADLVILMTLFNLILANRMARRTSILWGAGIFFFLLSDYVFSYQTLVQGYQVGSPTSLGWTMGGLIIAISVAVEAEMKDLQPSRQTASFDLGTRLQAILPITLVLVLIWFVLMDWRLRGQISVFGLSISVVLLIGLVVRLGVRAGESELDKYWQLFSHLAEPTFICDRKGTVLLANPALLEASNVATENLVVGNSLLEIFEADELTGEMFQRASRTAHNLEVRARASKLPYLLSLSPIWSEARQVYVAGVAYDVSEQKRQQDALQEAYGMLQAATQRLEEMNVQLEKKVEERTRNLNEAYHQLKESNEMLQAVDRMKSDFVSMVSHELRTPLTSLTGGLELLMSRKGRRQEDRIAMQLMKDEVQRLNRFVEAILNISSIEAGRLDVKIAPQSIQEIILDVLRQLNRQPGAARIETRIPEDLPSVLVDGTFLRSVITYLLDNALKYAPDGDILVEANFHRGRVRVQVVDNGPGIPADKRSLLFERFQRLDMRDSQSVYGYGLGLYLAKRLLKSMHSNLKYQNKPKGGSIFRFDLKVAG